MARQSTPPWYDLITAADGLYSSLRSDRSRARSTSSKSTACTNAVEYRWEHGMVQREVTQVEDRGYVVFCGNAHASSTATTTLTSGSFQIWGEDRGMRFAAVPYHRRTVDRIGDDGES